MMHCVDLRQLEQHSILEQRTIEPISIVMGQLEASALLNPQFSLSLRQHLLLHLLFSLQLTLPILLQQLLPHQNAYPAPIVEIKLEIASPLPHLLHAYLINNIPNLLFNQKLLNPL